jgi:hypothetical protein
MRHILVPKRGSTPRECEDAFSANLEALRFAIADGATEAYDSRRWARLLCRAWASSTSAGLAEADLLDGLRRLGVRFRRSRSQDAVPWYVEAKAEQGSFATFLGLELMPVSAVGGTWQATAIGDCCLAEFTSGMFRGSFPLERPEEFGSHPQAVPSRAVLNQDLCASARRKSGTYGPGDAFALMTDAVAHWFLAHVALHPGKLSDFLQRLREDTTGLCDGLMDAREAGQLRNDDIGLLFIECLPGPITTWAATP